MQPAARRKHGNHIQPAVGSTPPSPPVGWTDRRFVCIELPFILSEAQHPHQEFRSLMSIRAEAPTASQFSSAVPFPTSHSLGAEYRLAVMLLAVVD